MSVPSQSAALQSIPLCHPESSRVFFVFNFSCDENFDLVVIPRIKGYDLYTHRCSRVHLLLMLPYISDDFISL